VPTSAEPAPPGVSQEDLASPKKEQKIKDAEITLATEMKSIPEEESDWTPLHHLKHCCTTASDFVVDNIKGFTAKDKSFPFDELTNFQGSKLENGPITDDGNWNATGPFYTIGTLAFFMKCRGLKYSAYVRRTQAHGYKQYVKKADHMSVIAHLTSSDGKMAPFNVRPVGDLIERKTADLKEALEGKNFFSDRDHTLINQSINDDYYVIPQSIESDSEIELVYANWTDFYVGGVSIGKCDLRLLVKIGDKVRCQIHEMSSAEKRKLKKQIGSSTITTGHNATLIYVGSDKRPKSASMEPMMSNDLMSFLMPMGWSVDEFSALRTYGVRPPKEISATDLNDMAEQNAQVPIATKLAKETMKISSPDNPSVDNLLGSEEDIKVATFMSKILTKALINRTQKFLKAKLTDQFATPQFSSDMMTQISKIAAAETALSGNKEKSPSVPPVALAVATKPADAAEATETKKKRTPITAPEDTTKKMDLNEGLPKMIDEWTPLEYLRHFALNRKKITKDPRYIYFGRVKFFKSTQTNFQAENGDRDDDGVYPWYTLDHLYQAYLSKGMKHNKYLDKLRGLNLKHLNMNHRDRDSFLKYSSDSLQVAPSNVKRRTRRQLNPDQYLDHVQPAANKRMRMSESPGAVQDRFTLEALQQEEQENLKARMQIEMLKDQTRHQQAILDTRQEPQRSRFDQQYHPSQMSRPPPPPGVVTPQTIFVPNHPPQQVSMAPQQPSQEPWASRPPSHLRSRSPPDMAQGSYDSSRMRSRSPPRPPIINDRSRDRSNSSMNKIVFLTPIFKNS